MSNTVLRRARDFLLNAGLISGYAQRFHRWLDADLSQNTAVIVFRKVGEGDSDVFKQEHDLSITVMAAKASDIEQLGDDVSSIVREFRTGNSISGVIKFELLGTNGPFYTENERPLFTIDVRVFTEDQ